MSNNTKIEVRDLRNGDWYWIHKRVLKEYASKVGATGVAVYNLLASFANKDQSCFPSQKYIGKHLGYSRATVNKAVKLLERHGLVRIEKKSRGGCVYYLLRCKAEEIEVSNRGNSEVKNLDTNDNTIKRIINNIDKEDKNSLDSNQKTFKRFVPENREELLALDLAQTLNDLKGLPLYISYSKKYPEFLLRRVLGEVMEIPGYKIKKSRGALFNHLVQKYAKETN